MMARPENRKPDPALEALQQRYWEWYRDRVAEDRAESAKVPAEFDRLNVAMWRNPHVRS